MAASCANCAAELPAGARFCPSCASPVGDTGLDRLEERKLVTVLFADVTGSTALGERLDPERLRVLLQSYFAAMSAAVDVWGGTVEKYIGDAVMAAFGVPVTRENDAERALRAALEMLHRLDGLNSELEERHGVTLAIRIGVNTGEVIAPVGGPAGQLIVAGDAVNVAARLEQAAEPATILVGERTYLATRDSFSFDEPVELELKGKAAPVRARRLLGERLREKRDAADSDGQPWSLSAPMVGRDRELRAMMDVLSEAVDRGRPQLIVLYGPAGIGKSRMIDEFVTRAAHDGRPLRVLRGRCLAAGHGITYWPCAEILRAACEISLDEAVEVAQAKAITALARLLAPLGLTDAEVDQTINALAMTAGMAMPNNPLERLEPRDVAEELARAWPRFATALAAAGPTVLVVEDLHWAVEQMLEMVERLLARSEGPILLVATARPEFGESHPRFTTGREDVASISLRPLDDQQSGELVAGLLGESVLPATLRSEVLARAEGNPFFLEEILRRLADEGVLARIDGGWLATSRGSAALPDTIHGLLAARIDALPAAEKRVLQQAAVVGRIFWAEPVRRALGNGEVGGALLGLEGRGLISARHTSSIAGQAEYAFRHALVRDVAEASLPRGRRARSNAAVGAWAEELAGERRDEFIELIAHFYRSAVSGEDADLAWSDDAAGREQIRSKAFAAALRAGEVARQRYALAASLELHRAALGLATDDAERQHAHEALGDDERAAFHGDEAWAAYLEGIALARTRGDAEALARMASWATYLAALFGVFREAPAPQLVHELIEEGLRASGDLVTRGRLLWARSATELLWLRKTGSDPIDPAQRLADAEEVARLGRETGDAGLESLATDALSLAYQKKGDYTALLDLDRRNLELLDRVGSATQRAFILFASAESEFGLAGDHDTALALARRLYALGRDLSAHELMHATSLLVQLAYWSGRWDEIPPLLAEHLEALSGETERACPSMTLAPAYAALVDAARGNTTDARQNLGLVPHTAGLALASRAIAALALAELGDSDEARQLAEEVRKDASHFPHWALALTETLAGLQDWPALKEALDQLRPRVAADVLFAPAADRAEARRLLAAGELAEGERLLRRALGAYERLGVVFEAARTREHLAQAVSDTSERAAQLLAALETYERLGAAPHIARVRAALPTVEPVAREGPPEQSPA